MSDNAHIKLPDGSEKEMSKGTTALEVAKGISQRQGKIFEADQLRPTGFCGKQTKLREE
jgi:hypothetical protein